MFKNSNLVTSVSSTLFTKSSHNMHFYFLNTTISAVVLFVANTITLHVKAANDSFQSKIVKCAVVAFVTNEALQNILLLLQYDIDLETREIHRILYNPRSGCFCAFTFAILCTVVHIHNLCLGLRDKRCTSK
jgi:hypothetical protein